MDPSAQNNPIVAEDDEWDNDDFVIPSLEIEDLNQTATTNALQVEEPKQIIEAKTEENIYLGPHGAPPSQAKQEYINPSGRKQRFKQKLKDADQRTSGSGRENKLENLRDLVGVSKTNINTSKSSPRDWLDPHCHESEFEKQKPS
ncbi:hypothetical protein CTI12_AA025630 [Artemisia annua]|uniref:Uncharacterized protein n=1 Tax=Artemisia annua TaxID=35608 RepID=A0A2U1QH72_ARTAN|nr:hypothetical protein CTI12_AA025630 [Artemisia annua]